MKPNPSTFGPAVRRLNPSIYEQDIRVESARAIAELEHAAGIGPLAEGQAEEKDSGRFFVRVTSRRKRLLDEDNLAEKFHVDCCRYAGLLPKDTPECAHIEVRQEKVGKGEPEETVIEIFK